MKIVITGAGGQLGQDLVRVLSPLHEVIALTRGQLDVTNEQEVAEKLEQLRPEAIVHSAAYTQVDLAESQVDAAYMVNAFGARHLAEAAKRLNAKLVHISTDYVFDGEQEGYYVEQDRVNPLSVYGNSKLLGEKFVEMASAKHFIVRTSWLYGKHGRNFVTKVLAMAQAGRTLRMVNDQYGSPTYTLDLAGFISELLSTDKYGLYHYANRGKCTRYGLTKEILKAAGLPDVIVEPASAEEFPLPAERPVDSSLSDLAIRLNGFDRPRDWKSALHDFIQGDLQAGLAKEVKPHD